jgi:hypothetical protein
VAPRAGGAAASFIYAGESFAPAMVEAPLVVGFLIAQAPEVHIAAIRDIRRRTRYTGRAVTHRSTDAFKLGCARELVRYFVLARDLRFCARVVFAPGVGSDGFRAGQYSELFDTAGLAPGAVLRMKSRRRDRPFEPRLAGIGVREHDARVAAMRGKPRIVSAEAVTRSARDGLVDLAGLLTGTLFAGSFGDPYRLHPVKRPVLIRLRTLLGVERLTDRVAGKWEPAVLRQDGRARPREIT